MIPHLTTFTLFPSLPFELRLKIWDHALAEPRSVTIVCHREMLDRERRFAKAFTSSTPLIPLLHINRESRYEALSRCTRSFTTDTSPIYTYICFPLDTIKCADSVLEYMPHTEVQQIRRLVLDVRDAEYFGHFHMDVVKRMERLESLELLAAPGAIDYRWNRADRYVVTLQREFTEKRYEDPGWRCPRVRIVNKGSGEEVGVIEGGPLIEGWKEG
jgi:2EXR family